MRHRPTLVRYLVPVVGVCVAAVLRSWLDPVLTWKAPFVFFLLAILLSAWYGGQGPGFLATGLGVAVCEELFLAQPGRPGYESTADLLNLALVAVVGIAMSLLCGQMWTALARSVREEERFRLISNNVPQFLWTANPEGVHDFMSARWFEYSGADPGAPLGAGWVAFVHPDDLPRLSNYWEKLGAMGDGGMREFRIRRKDGVYHWFETRAVASRDAQGRVVKWFGSNTDVQETRELREMARVESERFAQIVATTPGLICEFVIRPNGTGGMPFASPAIRDIYGLEPSDVAEDASPIFERIHPDDREHVRNGVMESAQNLTVHRTEYRVLHPSKGEIWVSTQSVPRRAPDGATTWYGIVYDVTATKRAEEEIRELNASLEHRVNARTAQFESANRELEAFSYTVAHDLRAPLRHIAGFANILAEEHGGELSAEARSHLQNVQGGAQNMGSLIDDLLHLARIGRQPIAPRVSVLNTMVDAALGVLAPEMEGRDIRWLVGDLGTAECDAGLMQLVFVNLISNAIKYSKFRETAVIEVGRTRVGEESVIFVQDNGAGFEMQYAGKLFGVFQRLHKARDFEGTGVGLATVQRIIHNHGGRIWAEAEVNQGARFCFTIAPEMKEIDDAVRKS